MLCCYLRTFRCSAGRWRVYCCTDRQLLRWPPPLSLLIILPCLCCYDIYHAHTHTTIWAVIDTIANSYGDPSSVPLLYTLSLLLLCIPPHTSIHIISKWLTLFFCPRWCWFLFLDQCFGGQTRVNQSNRMVTNHPINHIISHSINLNTPKNIIYNPSLLNPCFLNPNYIITSPIFSPRPLISPHLPHFFHTLPCALVRSLSRPQFMASIDEQLAVQISKTLSFDLHSFVHNY